MNKFALFSCLSLMAGAVIADDSGPIRNGSIYYPTIEAACAEASDGDTIEILEDIDETGKAVGQSGKYYAAFTGNKFTGNGLTINAEGRTITVGCTNNAGTPIFVILNQNKVTINGGTWQLTDRAGYNDSGKIFYASGSSDVQPANLTLNNVVVDGRTAIGECIAVDADKISVVTVSRSTIMASEQGTGHVCAAISAGRSGSAASTVNVADSTIYGNIALASAKLQLTGNTTVSGVLTTDSAVLRNDNEVKKSENIALSPIAGYKWSAPDSDGLQTLVKAENAQTITIGSVGVTQITSTLKNTIVAVSFADLEEGGAIKVADLVKTDNLTEGDQLAVFNGGATYDTWTLANGAWVKNDKTYTAGADGLVEGEGTAADVTTKAVGTGFWLCRKTQPSGQFTFYTYGKPVETKTSTIPANTWTLVGNPTAGAVDLNGTKVSGAVKGDQIVTIGTNGIPEYWAYSAKNARWQRASTSGVLTLPALGPGHGLWIMTANGATINWK